MDLPDWPRMGLSNHIGASSFMAAEHGVPPEVRLAGTQAAGVGMLEVEGK